jgi:hypothetical protein
MKYRYNILIFIGRLAIVSFFVFVYYKFFSLVAIDNQIKDSIFLLIFFFLVFTFLSFSLIYSIIKETYSITIDNKSISRYRPLIMTGNTIEIDNIRGFSISYIKFGNFWGLSLFTCSSLIIYPIGSNPIEIIGFNYWRFKQIKDKLIALNIHYLGHEDYKTGLFFRKYKYK